MIVAAQRLLFTETPIQFDRDVSAIRSGGRKRSSSLLCIMTTGLGREQALFVSHVVAVSYFRRHVAPDLYNTVSFSLREVHETGN